MKKLLSLNYLFFSKQTRWFHPEVRLKIQERRSPKAMALEYFDFFYGTTFGLEWNQMRLAMLTGRKYVALVNNYSNRIETSESLEKLAALDLFDFTSRSNALLIQENFDKLEQDKLDAYKNFNAPAAWKVYTFDNGDTSSFPNSKMDHNKLQNYFCLDGASLLPVMALDVQKDDYILDLCASPGGKTIAMLQTMLPKKIECRDNNHNRIDRLKRTIRNFISEEKSKELIHIESNNQNNKSDTFDKVLVDAPCTNDRLSLHADDNNIFNKTRTDERSRLPKLQSDLLTQGVLSCKLNGTIVYSTCSLSPIQNEGVVNTVLTTFKNHPEFQLQVESVEDLKINMSYFFNFSKFCKLGLIVTPNISKNFGPFYLCKLSKLPK